MYEEGEYKKMSGKEMVMVVLRNDGSTKKGRVRGRGVGVGGRKRIHQYYIKKTTNMSREEKKIRNTI